MGTWMPDTTKKPTPDQKIKFGHDASDTHLYWADYLKEHPEYIGSTLLGDIDFQEECAVLHEETALELEELAEKQGEENPGCLLPFLRRSK